jgi:hypothetical protein
MKPCPRGHGLAISRDDRKPGTYGTVGRSTPRRRARSDWAWRLAWLFDERHDRPHQGKCRRSQRGAGAPLKLKRSADHLQRSANASMALELHPCATRLVRMPSMSDTSMYDRLFHIRQCTRIWSEPTRTPALTSCALRRKSCWKTRNEDNNPLLERITALYRRDSQCHNETRPPWAVSRTPAPAGADF